LPLGALAAGSKGLRRQDEPIIIDPGWRFADGTAEAPKRLATKVGVAYKAVYLFYGEAK
jgi:hypothetical protein